MFRHRIMVITLSWYDRNFGSTPSDGSMIVYKVVNKINGKAYIGQTTRSVEDRWVEHCKPALQSRSYLSNAIQKYGKENFIVEELSKANTQEELDTLESNLIDKHQTMFPGGYNLRMGGSGGAMSEEAKLKIGNASRGRKISREAINKGLLTRQANHHKRATFNEHSVKCGRCKAWKDRKDFNKNRSNKSGTQSCCIKCRHEHRPDWLSKRKK